MLSGNLTEVLQSSGKTRVLNVHHISSDTTLQLFALMLTLTKKMFRILWVIRKYPSPKKFTHISEKNAERKPPGSSTVFLMKLKAVSKVWSKCVHNCLLVSFFDINLHTENKQRKSPRPFILLRSWGFLAESKGFCPVLPHYRLASLVATSAKTVHRTVFFRFAPSLFESQCNFYS